MQDSSAGSDILGETIALYNALASSTNIIARSRSQLPQEEQQQQQQRLLDPVAEPSTQNPLDQEPEMINARLERIENEIDSRIENSNYFKGQVQPPPPGQPYNHVIQSGISLGTEDSQNISSQRIDYVQTKTHLWNLTMRLTE